MTPPRLGCARIGLISALPWVWIYLLVLLSLGAEVCLSWSASTHTGHWLFSHFLECIHVSNGAIENDDVFSMPILAYSFVSQDNRESKRIVIIRGKEMVQFSRFTLPVYFALEEFQRQWHGSTIHDVESEIDGHLAGTCENVYCSQVPIFGVNPLQQLNLLQSNALFGGFGGASRRIRLPANDRSRNEPGYNKKSCVQYELPLYFYVFIGLVCFGVAIIGLCLDRLNSTLTSTGRNSGWLLAIETR
jgi:hypothetical protein